MTSARVRPRHLTFFDRQGDAGYALTANVTSLPLANLFVDFLLYDIIGRPDKRTILRS